MDSITPNTEQNTDRSIESRSNKRRRIESVSSSDHPSSIEKIKWRSPIEQATYTSNLVKALHNTSPSSIVSSRGRIVNETADKVLAIAAKGRSRWSRAILAKRRKLQLKNHKKAAKSKTTVKRLKSGSRIRMKRLPELEKCVRVLGGLVPGGRKLSFPSLLEEATDYIAALEMQVRAMAVVTELLNGAGHSPGTSDRPGLS